MRVTPPPGRLAKAPALSPEVVARVALPLADKIALLAPEDLSAALAGMLKYTTADRQRYDAELARVSSLTVADQRELFAGLVEWLNGPDQHGARRSASQAIGPGLRVGLRELNVVSGAASLSRRRRRAARRYLALTVPSDEVSRQGFRADARTTPSAGGRMTKPNRRPRRRGRASKPKRPSRRTKPRSAQGRGGARPPPTGETARKLGIADADVETLGPCAAKRVRAAIAVVARLSAPARSVTTQQVVGTVLGALAARCSLPAARRVRAALVCAVAPALDAEYARPCWRRWRMLDAHVKRRKRDYTLAKIERLIGKPATNKHIVMECWEAGGSRRRNMPWQPPLTKGSTMRAHWRAAGWSVFAADTYRTSAIDERTHAFNITGARTQKNPRPHRRRKQPSKPAHGLKVVTLDCNHQCDRLECHCTAMLSIGLSTKGRNIVRVATDPAGNTTASLALFSDRDKNATTSIFDNATALSRGHAVAPARRPKSARESCTNMLPERPLFTKLGVPIDQNAVADVTATAIAEAMGTFARQALERIKLVHAGAKRELRELLVLAALDPEQLSLPQLQDAIRPQLNAAVRAALKIQNDPPPLDHSDPELQVYIKAVSSRLGAKTAKHNDISRVYSHLAETLVPHAVQALDLDFNRALLLAQTFQPNGEAIASKCSRFLSEGYLIKKDPRLAAAAEPQN